MNRDDAIKFMARQRASKWDVCTSPKGWVWANHSDQTAPVLIHIKGTSDRITYMDVRGYLADNKKVKPMNKSIAIKYSRIFISNEEWGIGEPPDGWMWKNHTDQSRPVLVNSGSTQCITFPETQRHFPNIRDFCEMGTVKRLTRPNKYDMTIRGTTFDVYDLLQAAGVTCPAMQHLIKKALFTGRRGHKDVGQDIKDVIASANRAMELHNEQDETSCNDTK